MNPPEVRPDIGTHISQKGQQTQSVSVKRDKPNTLQQIVKKNGGR